LMAELQPGPSGERVVPDPAGGREGRSRAGRPGDAAAQPRRGLEGRGPSRRRSRGRTGHARDAVGRGRHHPPHSAGGCRAGHEGARDREDALTRRALVTGGAGFIGSHVAEALLASDHDVVIIDDLSTGRRANVPQGARFAHLDIRSPEAALLVREARFDAIFMLAAQMDVRLSVADPMADASRNIIGTLNLLEAARHAPQRPRVIFSSTGGAIYGD